MRSSAISTGLNLLNYYEPSPSQGEELKQPQAGPSQGHVPWDSCKNKKDILDLVSKVI